MEPRPLGPNQGISGFSRKNLPFVSLNWGPCVALFLRVVPFVGLNFGDEFCLECWMSVRIALRSSLVLSLDGDNNPFRIVVCRLVFVCCVFSTCISSTASRGPHILRRVGLAPNGAVFRYLGRFARFGPVGCPASAVLGSVRFKGNGHSVLSPLE